MPKRKSERSPDAFAWGASIVFVIIVIVGQYVERGDSLFARAAGLVTLALACAFFFPPLFLLQRHGGAGAGQHPMQTNVVVDRGLYAIVRHPQYLGYILLVLGFICLFQNLVIGALGALARPVRPFQARGPTLAPPHRPPPQNRYQAGQRGEGRRRCR